MYVWEDHFAIGVFAWVGNRALLIAYLEFGRLPV